MKVFVTSKASFDRTMRDKEFTSDNIEGQAKTMFISINDSFGTDQVPYFENRSNVKVLFFDDVDEDIEIPITGTNEFKTAKAFSVDQGKELIEFLEANKDKANCIVHCSAGISRSGAIGAFVNDYFNGDWYDFKKLNPHIIPNGHVLRVLNGLFYERTNSI